MNAWTKDNENTFTMKLSKDVRTILSRSWGSMWWLMFKGVPLADIVLNDGANNLIYPPIEGDKYLTVEQAQDKALIVAKKSLQNYLHNLQEVINNLP